MSKKKRKCKEEPVVAPAQDVCTGNGMFRSIICLIIILIVLEFLCGVLCGCEEEFVEEG